MSAGSDRQQRRANPASPQLLEAILEAIGSVRFGTIQLIIQDGRVVQIDRTEKTRLV